MTTVPDEGVEGAGPAVRRRPRARFTVVLGIFWLVVPLVLFLLDRSVLLAGNPAQVIALAASGLIGVVLLVRERSDHDPRRPGARPWLRALGRVAGVLVTVVVLGALVWLRPFGATPEAVASMSGSADVRVTDAPAHIVIAPTSGTPTRGLIFQPGARVDPRAYVPMLSEVSRQGVIVFVVKQPFGIGFLAMTAPHAFIDRHPEVTSWVVGGHSLGGVVAATFAQDHPGLVQGLALWASYPVGSLADRTDLRVASVSGTRDGFTTPADIEASRALLPGDTAYTAVEGAVHSYFGDYGEQPGDGTPTVPRDDAQRQIVAATIALLDAL
ncbi:alpha/beta hydrolase [Terrabacter sp. LjRoot27]|uniref:alpha/beta hydrolase n=1 Tax=Terrabacter sp. LjRoot27 TaxID=3342306 RepID=UPI003ED0BCEF